MFVTGLLVLFVAALVAAPVVTVGVLCLWIPVEREAARVRQEAREALEGGSDE